MNIPQVAHLIICDGRARPAAIRLAARDLGLISHRTIRNAV